MQKREEHISPICDSTDAVPLAFGYPTPETQAAAERGDVALGGCLCSGDERDPRWCCRNCGRFYGGESE